MYFSHNDNPCGTILPKWLPKFARHFFRKTYYEENVRDESSVGYILVSLSKALCLAASLCLTPRPFVYYSNYTRVSVYKGSFLLLCVCKCVPVFLSFCLFLCVRLSILDLIRPVSFLQLLLFFRSP